MAQRPQLGGDQRVVEVNKKVPSMRFGVGVEVCRPPDGGLVSAYLGGKGPVTGLE